MYNIVISSAYPRVCYAMLTCIRLFATPARILFHGDSPGKNTGVGCHAPSRGSSQPRSPTMQMESLPCPPVSIVIYTWRILSSTELNRFSTVGIHRAVISNTDCGSLKEKYSI